MTLRGHVRAGGVCAWTLVLIAGCASSAAEGPSSSAEKSVGVSSPAIGPSSARTGSAGRASLPASAIDPSPSTSAPSTTSRQESADRAAVEAQWARFWQVYNNMVRTPSEQRGDRLDEVAVEPIKSQILGAAEKFDKEGIDYFGSVVQHPYWTQPIGQGSVAVMRDCKDQSGYGSVWVATGQRRSIGVSNNNLQAEFIRGYDDIWRVQTFGHLSDEVC